MPSIFRLFASFALFTAILSSCWSSGSLSMMAEELSSPSSTRTHVEVVSMHSAIGLPNSFVVPDFPHQCPPNALVLPLSSGERVTFDQSGGSWYAETSQGRLPVESDREQPSIGAYLSWLGDQDVSVVRSRLHIISSIDSPTGSKSVYLGKLGLFGGAPAGLSVEWYPGPHIISSRYDARGEVYYIPLPASYRYWGYRELPGSIVQRASCTIRYVAADSEEAIDRLKSYDFQDESTLEAHLLKDFVHVVYLGALEGEDGNVQIHDCPDDYTLSFAHAALVVYVDTKKSRLPKKESKVNVQLEIGMAPVLSVSLVAPTPSLIIRSPVLTYNGAIGSHDEEREVYYAPPQAGVHCQAYTLPEAFGAQAWKEHFGVEVDEEPPLPVNIEETLNSEAPFLLEDRKDRQRIRENHLLTLIPSKVDGEAFTLDKLGELILPYFPKNNENDVGFSAHGYDYYSPYLTHYHRKEPLSAKAYWLLLPKTLLADSRGKTFGAQQAMVRECGRIGYRLPRVLEVATSLLAHYVRSKERLYQESSAGLLAYTRCSDVDENEYPLVVGGFGPSGIYLGPSRFEPYDILGVSCCWRL